MKILALHVNHIKFQALKKAIKSAEDVDTSTHEVGDSLVILSAVEKRDESSPSGTVKRLIKEIKNIADQLKAQTIVLYPYAHLSSDLSSPDTAQEVLKSAEEKLSRDYKVIRAPFGWYKSFEIACKGHPLSELSREFGPEEIKKGHDKPFVMQIPTGEQKIQLTLAFAAASASGAIPANIGIHREMGYVDIKGSVDIDKLRKDMKKLLSCNPKIQQSSKEPNDYQKEIMHDIKDAKVYEFGETVIVPPFEDPFVDTDKIKCFKVIEKAAAYWKNNLKNEQLNRVYVIGFDSERSKADYEKRQEEIEKRDHRRIGKQMELFSVHKEAPGMPFFHDKGLFVFNKLADFMTEEMRKLNYEINRTPLILNKKLWLQSGHWDHYKENMYFTKIDNEEYAIKPMNCPGNILVFKNRPHSYKELPIKAGEFGLVHRHELSGVLSGLFRVRVFTQDDAHVFCTTDQMKEQIVELIELMDKIYSTFGFEYFIELSTRPEKAMGDVKTWEFAEQTLADALKSKKKEFKINEGDGAFYGPKIDFHIKDAIGRSWQCGTIQLDFSMPEKFDLSYEGTDGRKHRPVMIHRAIYGSFERFMGILIEHFEGKFPLWLNPVQVKVLTVTDRNIVFAEEIIDILSRAGVRVQLDDRTETIGRKIRDAQMEKVNYMITIGDKETESRKLAVRTRSGEVGFDVNIEEFIEKLRKEVKEKTF